jgi:hypothetical protein
VTEWQTQSRCVAAQAQDGKGGMSGWVVTELIAVADNIEFFFISEKHVLETKRMRRSMR